MARKLGLAYEQVVDAAAEIADADGLDAVTLASVAARLGMRAPSLYAHVDGLNGLRRALALRGAGLMADAFEAATAGAAGLDAIRGLAHAYRAFAREHRGLYAAAQRAVRPGEDDELYRALAAPVAPVARALAEAGVPDGERIHVARVLRSALHGFAALEAGGGFGMPQSVDESFGRLVDLLVGGIASAAEAAK
jgi:AcrR family transcriptional regulator